MEPSASRWLTSPSSHSCAAVEPGANSCSISTACTLCRKASSWPGRRRRLLGRPWDGVCSTLQLKPVPGSPTVLRGLPLRLTGMLKEAPRPPTEIELRPPLLKLKRRGPRRAERRKRKPMDQRLFTQ